MAAESWKNLPKRVPVSAKPHEGVSTCKESSASTARRRSFGVMGRKFVRKQTRVVSREIPGSRENSYVRRLPPSRIALVVGAARRTAAVTSPGAQCVPAPDQSTCHDPAQPSTPQEALEIVGRGR